MRQAVRMAHLFITLLLTAMGICLIYLQKRSPALEHETHPPTKEISQSLRDIEVILNNLAEQDPEAVIAVARLLAEVAREQNDRTTLLQQRASSLLAAAALVVSIISTSINFLIKDAKERLSSRDVYLLSYSLYCIMLIFGVSLYWTWKGFGTRPFVYFNVENLLDNMAAKGADLHTSQVVAAQQSYQVIRINSALNTEKAAALRWATADFFLGLLLFSSFCLFLLTKMNRSSTYEGEDHVGDKKERGSQETTQTSS